MDRFDDQGYLVFDLDIPASIPAEMASFEAYRAGRRVQDAWRSCPSVRALALHPDVLGLLESLYGRKPRPFQTLNFSMGTEQAVHSDTVHFNSDPPGFMCGVWVALEPVDADNGPLVYYPGSHKLPEWNLPDAGLEAIDENYPAYETWMAEQIERMGLLAEYSFVGAGQAIVWAANLLHGGMPVRDRSRTRHSQVTHYFFEGEFTFRSPRTGCERRPEWIV